MVVKRSMTTPEMMQTTMARLMPATRTSSGDGVIHYKSLVEHEEERLSAFGEA